MYTSVIVPLDRTQSAEAALPAALAFARQAGVPLQLLSVVDAPDTFVSWSHRTSSIEWLERQQHDTQSYSESLVVRLGYPAVETRVAVGEPVWSIYSEAGQAPEPLLVMARRARSVRRERFSRGVTLRIARVLSCPLVIIPAGTEADVSADFALDWVLVPLDRSRSAERVLQAVSGDVLIPERLHLHLLTVIDTAAWHSSSQALMYAYDFDRYVDDMRRVASRYLTRVHETLVSAGAEVSCDLRVGRVAEQICRAAEEADVNLIAMTTHSRSGFERFFLGSVAEAVVTEAHRPVLLIRAAAEAMHSLLTWNHTAIAGPGNLAPKSCALVALRTDDTSVRRWT